MIEAEKRFYKRDKNDNDEVRRRENKIMVSKQLLNALDEHKKQKRIQEQYELEKDKEYAEKGLQEVIKQENIRNNFLKSIKNFQSHEERIQEMRFNSLGNKILENKKLSDENFIYKQEQDSLHKIHKQEIDNLKQKYEKEKETFETIKAQLQEKELRKRNENEYKKYLREEINENLNDLQMKESQRSQLIHKTKNQYLQELVYQMNKNNSQSSNNLNIKINRNENNTFDKSTSSTGLQVGDEYKQDLSYDEGELKNPKYTVSNKQSQNNVSYPKAAQSLILNL